MKATILAALAAFVLAGSADAQSRQPPQQPSARHQTAAADQRSTTGQPLVVNVIPANPNQPETAQQRHERDWQTSRDTWMIVLTAGLVVAAALQAWFSGVAARGLEYARRSADAAEANITTIENTSKQQSRAYVLMDKAKLGLKNPAPNAFLVEVLIRIENFGQSPAFGVSLATNGMVGPPDLARPDFDKMTPIDLRTSQMIMGPGAKLEFPPFAIELSEPDFNRLRIQERHVYAWGVIDYTDAFGEKRKTTFFVHTQGEAGGRWPVAPCKDGNSAT
jgi:hypothetical protein